MVLTKEFKEMARDVAKKMKGVAKRAFMAQITREYLGGSALKGERELGWYRKTVEKGLKRARDRYPLRGQLCGARSQEDRRETGESGG
jgi:hypothetical protein